MNQREFQSASYQKGITEMKRKIDELITLRMRIIADTRPEERLDSFLVGTFLFQDCMGY